MGKKQNNCFAWGIDYYRNSGDHKLQPGELAREAGLLGPKNSTSLDLQSCSDIARKVILDAKALGHEMVQVQPDTPCPKDAYKIMAVIAPGRDFHFYRFHRDVLYKVKTPRTIKDIAKEFGVSVDQIHAPVDGLIPKGVKVLIKRANLWSHKQGFSPDGPILTDACDKLIKDPRVACRSYGNGLDYTKDCATFCFTKK